MNGMRRKMILQNERMFGLGERVSLFRKRSLGARKPICGGKLVRWLRLAPKIGLPSATRTAGFERLKYRVDYYPAVRRNRGNRMASVAVAWLKEADWGEWEKLDDQLPDYAQWSVKVGDAIIDVEPKLFKAWCNSGGVAVK